MKTAHVLRKPSGSRPAQGIEVNRSKWVYANAMIRADEQLQRRSVVDVGIAVLRQDQHVEE